MICMITYDLNSPGQNYEKFINAIKECSSGEWCTFWKSSYLIKTNKTVNEIVSKLKVFCDANDRLIVIEVKKNYQGLLRKKDWQYINQMFG